MHQPPLFILAEPQRLGQTVHVAALARTTLHRQARRFVQRDDIVIPIDHRLPDHRDVGIADVGDARLRRDLRRVGQRRHPDDLTFFDTRRGFHTATIDADVALAAQFFDPSLGHMRKAAAKPAVQPLVRILGGYLEVLDAAHDQIQRADDRPTAIASSDSTTEAAA